NAGMIVCPCSMSSLAAIATGVGSNLIHRAADVALKERRPLVLAIRETPYNLTHIRNMLAATEAGAIIMPFSPAFYTGDQSLSDLARQFAGRMLDQLRLPHALCRRWGEDRK
ncbi:MAG: UbiX family flavin prenyltransferase, partial [Desulfovibrio sp.]|nr:UbiX family flavin prenyltransferase [Desulfovibrio sp.]